MYLHTIHEIRDSSIIPLSEFNIYPQPANNHINVAFRCNGHEYVGIRILDINGKEIINIQPQKYSQGNVVKPIAIEQLKMGTYFILEDGKARKLVKRDDIRGNLHGRACADFDMMAEQIAIPDELHPDNPIADDVFVVIHGAGAYSHYMERNFWCGITPPMKMNYAEFKNCITQEKYYQIALVNSYAERSGLPLKNAMSFINNATNSKLGQIKGAEIAQILDNPELLNKLGLHILGSVAEFVREHSDNH